MQSTDPWQLWRSASGLWHGALHDPALLDFDFAPRDCASGPPPSNRAAADGLVGCVVAKPLRAAQFTAHSATATSTGAAFTATFCRAGRDAAGAVGSSASLLHGEGASGGGRDQQHRAVFRVGVVAAGRGASEGVMVGVATMGSTGGGGEAACGSITNLDTPMAWDEPGVVGVNCREDGAYLWSSSFGLMGKRCAARCLRPAGRSNTETGDGGAAKEGLLVADVQIEWRRNDATAAPHGSTPPRLRDVGALTVTVLGGGGDADGTAPPLGPVERDRTLVTTVPLHTVDDGVVASLWTPFVTLLSAGSFVEVFP